MTRIDRRALFTSGAAAALLAATGVSATPRRGGHLRAALSGASRSDSLDAPAGHLFMKAVHSTLYEGLTEIAGDGTVRPLLAAQWRSDDGGRLWQFTLRDGVDWSDGSPLKPEDIAQQLAGLGRWRIDGAKLGLELLKPNPNLPYLLAGTDFLMRSAKGGTGPYEVAKFDAGRQFIATRKDKHWRDGQVGWFDRVEFGHFASEDVRIQAVAEGLADVADVRRMPDLPDVQRLPDQANLMQIARRTIALPAQVGRASALDNLRFAERWWMA